MCPPAPSVHFCSPLADDVNKKMVLSRLMFELKIALALLWTTIKQMTKLTLLGTMLAMIKIKKKILIKLALLEAMFMLKGS